MIGKTIITSLLLSHFFIADAYTPITIAEFSELSLKGWKEKVFKPGNIYQLIQKEKKYVLMVKSENSASGLIKKMRIDIKQYPYMSWHWRIER